MKTVQERFLAHKWDALNKDTRKMVLHKAMVKYGVDNFYIFEIEQICAESKEELREMLNIAEINYIEKYNTITPYGYNVSAGGYTVPPDRTMTVFCFNMDGTFVNKFNSLNEAEELTGVKHSMISRVLNDEHPTRKSTGGYLWSLTDTPPVYDVDCTSGIRRPVSQFSKDGELISVYNSSADAARKLNLQQSLISACCNSRRKTTGGYRWSFYYSD